MDPELNSVEAAAHLLEHRHLSVFDRAVFEGTIPLSLLVHAAQRLLARTAFLPSTHRPEEPFSGVMLERRGGTYWIHEKGEIGVSRYSEVVSRPARDLEEAVRAYVGSGMDIDGLPVEDDLQDRSLSGQEE